jgi:hypothetical protein
LDSIVTTKLFNNIRRIGESIEVGRQNRDVACMFEARVPAGY